MKTSLSYKVITFIFTLFILLIGYIAFGFITSLIFASGFLTGYLLWLFIDSNPGFAAIRWPYWITLILFVVHRVEEKVMNFFDELALITGVATPSITSIPVILLVLISVGAWLAIPYLMRRRLEFGNYLAWTFFAAMGITELAHFVFPLFTAGPYRYFPGMVSVFVLAPVACWGMFNMTKSIFN